REILNEQAIEYSRSIMQQVRTTGELPEGNYRLCIRILNTNMQPLSAFGCGTLTIVLPEPPQLIAPLHKLPPCVEGKRCDCGCGGTPRPFCYYRCARGSSQAQPPLAQSAQLLTWTPLSIPLPTKIPNYRLTVKPLYTGQTIAQAMASNPLRIQEEVPTTNYRITPGTLEMDTADPNCVGYVWQVQALYDGRPYGRNQGYSQIGAVLLERRQLPLTPALPTPSRRVFDVFVQPDKDTLYSIIGEVQRNARDTFIIRIRGIRVTNQPLPLALVCLTPDIAHIQPIASSGSGRPTVRRGPSNLPVQPGMSARTVVVAETEVIWFDITPFALLGDGTIELRLAVASLQSGTVEILFGMMDLQTLREIWEFIRTEGRDIKRKVWDFMKRYGSKAWKIFKKLALPLRAIYLLIKYFDDIVYCYTYCAQLDANVREAEYGTSDYLYCVDRCLAARLGDSYALQAIKDVIGLGLLEEILRELGVLQ
ncbi:MAG: hypothetical protein NZ473_04710, partial [Candidatus Kapabacteria bacterium]|nr:hypothetical protein [Candidatus Kapabacteria bacterium]MDW8225475.1 hypothetical protein [Bacteroidota bacterium]